MALYRHYSSGGDSLYQPGDMRRFCKVHSPGLFDMLLSSITRVDGRPTTKDHSDIQQQRIVGLLHRLAYFRYSMQNILSINTFHHCQGCCITGAYNAGAP